MGGGGGGGLGAIGQGLGGVIAPVTQFATGAARGVFGGNNPSPYFADPGPKPDRPEFQTLIGDNDLLRKNLQLTDKGPINQDKQVLEMLRGQALAGPGNSAWEKMAMNRQALEESSLKDKALAGAGQAQASARSGLAMRGGLESGARERLALQGQNNLMTQMQDVSASGARARADIGLEAEKQRQGLAQQLPGMELQAIQPDLQNRQYSTEVQKYNIDQAVNEKRAKDMADMAAYQEQMKAWAAAQTGNAMASAQGKK